MKVNQADKSNPINNSIFNKDKFNIAFSVGEISGDINASALIKEINCRMPNKVYSWGIGGMRMREVGVDTILDTSKMGTIGVFETLKLIPSFIYQYNCFKKAILDVKPDLLVPVDFGFFNSRLAMSIAKDDIPILYYFPPSSWRRTLKNADVLKESKAKVITPFPWSAEILKSFGIEAGYVGHPLVDIARPNKSFAEFAGENDIDTDFTIGFLAGSRSFEIDSHIELYCNVIKRLNCVYPKAVFLIGATKEYSGYISSLLDRYLDSKCCVRLITGDTYNVMAHSRFLCCCSGTATLEAGIIGTPMAIIYRGTKIMRMEYELRKHRVNHFIGLPNIVLDEYVCPEILGKYATQDRLYDIINSYLTDDIKYFKMKEKLLSIKDILGGENVIPRVADLFINMADIK